MNTVTVQPIAPDTDPIQGDNTATVRDDIGLEGDLAVVKTDGQTTAVPGTAIVYTITVSNTGPSAAIGAVVSDPFPATLSGVTWKAAYAGGATGPLSGSGDLAAVVDVPPGATVVFTVEATIDPAAAGTLVNTATVVLPPDFVDPNPDNNTSTDTNGLVPTADLGVDKSRTTGSVVAGQSVSYQIVVTNFGPSSVSSFNGVDVTTPSLVNPSYTVSTGSYDPTTGVWLASPGDTLTTGETVVFTLSGVVPATATGLLVNTATVSPPPGVTDPNPDNDTDTVSDPITAQPRLRVTKTDGSDTYNSGGTTTYTIVVTNDGPSFLAGGLVNDPLPPQVASATWIVTYTGAGSGGVGPDSGTGSIVDKQISLAVGGTATFTIVCQISTTASGDMINTVTVTPPPGAGLPVSATDISAFDGPINPFADIRALVIGSDDGCNGPPVVRVLDPQSGATVFQFLAYEPKFRGSVRVATGDVTGDGVPEIVVGPGRGRAGQIRVFTPSPVGSVNYAELPLYRTLPFGAAYRGGVEVAVGDVNGDGIGDIIAGQSSGAGLVRAFLSTQNETASLAVDGVANVPFRSFRPFAPPYAGGVMIAAGDFGSFSNGNRSANGPDGIDEIVVGSNAGIRATVRVYDVSGAPRVVRTIRPFAANFRGGVTLSVARYDGDAIDDIIVGSGVRGRSLVEVYDGAATDAAPAKLAVFSSFAKTNARVFTAALDSVQEPGSARTLYGVKGLSGGGGAKGVRAYDLKTLQTSTLPGSTNLVPPLRIAPIIVRVAG